MPYHGVSVMILAASICSVQIVAISHSVLELNVACVRDV